MRTFSITTILLVLLTLASHGQSIENSNWSTELDFQNSEEQIIQNILWLEENPFATESNDTKAISEYVLKWLTGAPYLSVTLDHIFTESISSTKRYKYADKMRVTYLFGKSLHVIQAQSESDFDGNISEVDASYRGVIGMIKVYKELLKQDKKAYHKKMDYYSDMLDNESLYQYVQKELELFGIG